MRDRTGLPLTVLISAANVHDWQLMVPLLDSLAPVQSAHGRPRRRPAKLHADKPYDIPALPPQDFDAGDRADKIGIFQRRTDKLLQPRMAVYARPDTVEFEVIPTTVATVTAPAGSILPPSLAGSSGCRDIPLSA
jgi:hypothetical protein